MLMTTIQRLAVAGVLAVALAGCAKGKDEQLAYDVCLAAAKNEPNYAKAAFTTKEQSNIQASTGDSAIRVNIPYELDGKKGLYQCIADKQTDGTYKVTF
jgi:predicted component of type VI protein secretion system